MSATVVSAFVPVLPVLVEFHESLLPRIEQAEGGWILASRGTGVEQVRSAVRDAITVVRMRVGSVSSVNP